MEIIAEYGTVFLILAGVFGLFMAWGIGANDVANAMATSVGSKALTIKQAVIVAAIFEFAGAILAGGQVTKTIRKGIVDADLLSATPAKNSPLEFYSIYNYISPKVWQRIGLYSPDQYLDFFCQVKL